MIFFTLIVSACSKQAEETTVDKEETEGIMMGKLIIETGDQEFTAALYDNNTAKALLERLPMTLSMEELHGNEKYNYLNEELPANPQKPDGIHMGDIMLYGSDCLVLFFENTNTSYSYTRIGRIEDASGFAEALTRGVVEITFRIPE